MMKKQKSTPTGLTETFKDSTIAEYTDGTWRYTGDNGKTKGALARKPAWLTPFNKETSVEAHEAKVDKRRETFKRGIIAGTEGVVPGKTITDADEAFQCVVEVRTEVALSGDPGSLADAKWLDEALYGSQKKDKDLPKIVIQVDGDFVQAAQLVRERHAIEDTVIEGEYVDQG